MKRAYGLLFLAAGGLTVQGATRTLTVQVVRQNANQMGDHFAVVYSQNAAHGSNGFIEVTQFSRDTIQWTCPGCAHLMVSFPQSDPCEIKQNGTNTVSCTVAVNASGGQACSNNVRARACYEYVLTAVLPGGRRVVSDPEVIIDNGSDRVPLNPQRQQRPKQK